MRRGDIYIANLNPVQGSEADKQRPVVIVSNDASNQAVEKYGVGMLTVVPLTTNVTAIYPFQVFLSAELTTLDKDSKVQPEQIRAISTNRIRGPIITSLPGSVMSAINQALKQHLAL